MIYFLLGGHWFLEEKQKKLERIRIQEDTRVPVNEVLAESIEARNSTTDNSCCVSKKFYAAMF